MTMTSNLLDDPNCQINSEINEQMDIFVRCCIRYLEIQDRWHDESPFGQSDADEDVLFPSNSMTNNTLDNTIDSTISKKKPTTNDTLFGHNSFWGKTITKRSGNL